MFKQHSKGSHILMLLLFGLLWSCNVEQISSDLDPTEIASRTGEDGCQVRIIGKVVSTQDLLGVAGATVSSEEFPESVQTDENGDFQIDLLVENGQSIQTADVEVELDGYLLNTFQVDLNQVVNQADCPMLTTLTWDIGITPLESSFLISTEEATTVTIEDTVAVIVYNT